MTVTTLRGDCRAILPTLPAGSFQTCVTSPPYYGLRSYLPDDHPEKHLEIGSEPAPEAYVAALVEVFREVRRVLRDEGTLWLNIGDSYASSPPGNKTVGVSAKSGLNGVNGASGKYRETLAAGHQTKRDTSRLDGIKPKDLLGIPWLLAFALRADGWFLRSDIIWHKPNPMPESVRDRPTSAHEHVFLLTKRAAYFYDADAIREENSNPDLTECVKHWTERPGNGEWPAGTGGRMGSVQNGRNARNARNVWTIATQPYPGAHFATMPRALAERCILAGTSERGACPHCGAPWARVVEKTRTFESNTVRAGNEPKGKHGDKLQGGGETGDIRRGPVVHATTTGWAPSCACPAHTPIPCAVLDPFGGAGTTALVADRIRRDATIIDLNPEYREMAKERVKRDAPLLAVVA